jgi:hypothetical protein
MVAMQIPFVLAAPFVRATILHGCHAGRMIDRPARLPKLRRAV